jgi:hypothetical protein
MRLGALLIATLAGHAAPVAADWMESTWGCFPVLGCAIRSDLYSYWHTDYGTYWVDTHDGCYESSNVPGMEHYCVDIPRARAEFRFWGQDKRCLKKNDAGVMFDCDEPACWHDYWWEVPCTW